MKDLLMEGKLQEALEAYERIMREHGDPLNVIAPQIERIKQVSFVVTCPTCAQRNRAQVGKMSRCGKCQRVFTKEELVAACMATPLFVSPGIVDHMIGAMRRAPARQAAPGTTALITCACGTKNRIALRGRSRCGKCKHVFTPTELAKAQVERPATFGLEQQDDAPPTHACKNEDECGWSGVEDDLDENERGKACCPDCGRGVRKLSKQEQEDY